MVIGIIPPDEHRIIASDGKTITVEHSVGIVEGHGWNDLPEEERKQLAKEYERERAKVDQYNPGMVYGGPFAVGGYGHWTQQGVSARELWTPMERKLFKDFLQLRRKWMAEVIPIEKEALRTKLLKVYKTTNPQEYEQMLSRAMVNDPRLSIKTRRGTVRTTVSANRAFHASKASGSLEVVKK